MIRSFKQPIPTHAAKPAVHAFAEKLAGELGVTGDTSLSEVVSRIGGSIRFHDPVGEDFPESIEVRGYGDFTIFLPTMTSLERDRFTTAHELGHYFLHYPLVAERFPGDGMKATRWVDETNAELQRTEWEANWFAAGFVMPEAEFRRVYNSDKVSNVASLFGVSPSAVRVRASSLGL